MSGATGRDKGSAVRNIYVPWTVKGYPNGAHPLLSPLTEPTPGGDGALTFLGPQSGRSLDEARTVADAFVRTARATAARFRGHAVVRREDVVDFVRTRNAALHLAQPPRTDLTFHHTVPWSIGTTPWVLHLEMPTLAFLPYLSHGTPPDRPLRSMPVYWLVRDLLESPACRAIFTHLRGTAGEMGSLFDSTAIAAKTHHVPPGPGLTAADELRLAAGRKARRSSPQVTILFTNSWHQQEESFFLRGGAELVEAFFSLKEDCPDLRLVLRSALPASLGTDTIARLRADPAVRVIDRPVSEGELIGLYAEADIFALPAAGLHCLSVLRAFHAGAVCVTSDAPGYEELVADGVTGIVLPGRRSTIYGTDPESGWRWDDYRPMFRRDPVMVGRLRQALHDLCRDPDRRWAIADRALAVARTRFTMDGWRQGAMEVLRAALECGSGGNPSS